MVKSSRQKKKVTNKRGKRQSKKKVLRGGMGGRPMAQAGEPMAQAGGTMAGHMCPFTPETISDIPITKYGDDKSYTVLKSGIFEDIKDDLRYVEINGGVDQGGRVGSSPEPKHLKVFPLRPEPLKATELLFSMFSEMKKEDWRMSTPLFRSGGVPNVPKVLVKRGVDKNGIEFTQKIQRLNSNESLPLPGAIAKWTGGGGGTAYIVCKSKIQPDLDICRHIVEMVEHPYFPPLSEEGRTFIKKYNNFLSKPLPVKTGENIYA